MLGKMKTLLCCATLLAGTGLATNAARAADVSVTRADSARPVAFDVLMPLRNRDKLEAFVADLHNPASPNFHKWVNPAEFGMRFGPETSKIETVAASLRARGFDVTVQTRSVHVNGTAAQVEQHFGTKLLVGRTAEGGTHIMQASALKLPPEIAATGAQVLSFSPHMMHTMSRVVTGKLSPTNRYGKDGGYWFDDLKQAYSYPSIQDTVKVKGGKKAPLNGTGVTLGVLMSSDVFDTDIQAIFDHEAYHTITLLPDPTLFARVYVNGGATTASGALDEASLDTQEELTGAPGAHVILYDIPDLSDGNVSAGYITIDEYNAVDLVSSSFGGCERDYSPAYNGGQSYYGILAAQHELFLQGNAQGITFLASSGDSAGKECPAPAYFFGANSFFGPGVETPASDPNVTAVGGGNVVTSATAGSLDSIYASENGWSDPEIPYDPYSIGFTASGGFWGAGSGYSVYFAQPSYQTLVTTGSTKARSVPDIGMQVGGCPGGIAILDPKGDCNGGFGNGTGLAKNGNGNTDRSYAIVAIGVGQGGGYYGLIGTSVSSPEFAGAAALLIEQKGRQGNLNNYIYNLAAQQAAGNGTFFHTSIPGYNGIVNTNLNKAYSLTYGVGSPIVSAFVGAGSLPVAGTPLSVSNP